MDKTLETYEKYGDMMDDCDDYFEIVYLSRQSLKKAFETRRWAGDFRSDAKMEKIIEELNELLKMIQTQKINLDKKYNPKNLKGRKTTTRKPTTRRRA